MASLKERREALFPQYERPEYYGTMKSWRVVLVREWLQTHPGSTYLDVGCGPAETLEMAKEMGLLGRGCDVVKSVCDRADVDLIPGAHDLPYREDQFDIATCNDVLEHILEADVSATLSELRRVTKGAILLGISRKPGPFHPTIKSTEWWMDKIDENMSGAASIIYAARTPKIKRPYLWVSIE